MACVEKRGTRWRVRYQREDGTLGSVNGFPTKSAALERAGQIEADQQRNTFIDPTAGRITLGEWVDLWRDGQHAAEVTRATRESHLRTHILPRYGTVPLNAISRLGVKAWANQLRGSLSDRTTGDVVRLLSLLLNEAVEDRRIPANPCRGLRLRAGPRPERPHATAVAGIYSHVTDTVTNRLIDGLQRRWEDGLFSPAENRSSQFPPTSPKRPADGNRRQAA